MRKKRKPVGERDPVAVELGRKRAKKAEPGELARLGRLGAAKRWLKQKAKVSRRISDTS
jgi:hypothetical protein